MLLRVFILSLALSNFAFAGTSEPGWCDEHTNIEKLGEQTVSSIDGQMNLTVKVTSFQYACGTDADKRLLFVKINIASLSGDQRDIANGGYIHGLVESLDEGQNLIESEETFGAGLPGAHARFSDATAKAIRVTVEHFPELNIQL